MTVRTFAPLLGLLVASVASAEDLPTVETLPPVDTGQEAIGGDYLDLSEKAEAPPKKTVQVKITAKGLVPRFFQLGVGERTKLVFSREPSATCEQIDAKDLGVSVMVPAGKEASVIVTPSAKGNFALTCKGGMTGAGVKVE